MTLFLAPVRAGNIWNEQKEGATIRKDWEAGAAGLTGGGGRASKDEMAFCFFPKRFHV